MKLYLTFRKFGKAHIYTLSLSCVLERRGKIDGNMDLTAKSTRAIFHESKE